MPFSEALVKAEEQDMDLILVAPKAKPPVCRIDDFGKLLYKQKRKKKKNKKASQSKKLKEMKFRLTIEEHDYNYKVKHVREFLEDKHIVKVTIMFRGREMAHKEMGFDLIERIIEDLKDVGASDKKPQLVGRNIFATFAPKN